MFCKHKWKLLEQTTTKSKFEHCLEKLRQTGVTESLKLPHQLACANRKFIEVYTCEKCGDLKRFVENI